MDGSVKGQLGGVELVKLCDNGIDFWFYLDLYFSRDGTLMFV